MSVNEVSAHAPVGGEGSLEVYGRALGELSQVCPLQRLVEQIEMEMVTSAMNNRQTAAIYRHAVSDFHVRGDSRGGQRQLNLVGAAAWVQANAVLFHQSRERAKP